MFVFFLYLATGLYRSLKLKARKITFKPSQWQRWALHNTMVPKLMSMIRLFYRNGWKFILEVGLLFKNLPYSTRVWSTLFKATFKEVVWLDSVKTRKRRSTITFFFRGSIFVSSVCNNIISESISPMRLLQPSRVILYDAGGLSVPFFSSDTNPRLSCRGQERRKAHQWDYKKVTDVILEGWSSCGGPVLCSARSCCVLIFGTLDKADARTGLS